MRYISLGENYDGARLSINNFPQCRTLEINAMLATLVELRNVKTEARRLISEKIVTKMREFQNVSK